MSVSKEFIKKNWNSIEQTDRVCAAAVIGDKTMYRIIIVDDEPKIGEGLVHLFPWENLGFEVAGFFTDGKTALDHINSHQDIDVVMTDIQMPGMTGI